MDQIEKLRVLIPHWIEHNKGHGTDCKKWVDIAKEEGKDEIAGYIEDAIEAMGKVNELLEKALQEAGGASEEHHHHHHH